MSIHDTASSASPTTIPYLLGDYDSHDEGIHFFENRCSEITQCTLACICCVTTSLQLYNALTNTDIHHDNNTSYYLKKHNTTYNYVTISHDEFKIINIVKTSMLLIICMLRTKHIIKNRCRTYNRRSENIYPDLKSYALISLLSLSYTLAYRDNYFQPVILSLSAVFNFCLVTHLCNQTRYRTNSNVYRFMRTGQM